MIHNKTIAILSTFLCLLVLSGCAGMIGKAYQQPEVALPDQWQTQPETGEQVLATQQWWQVFEDPQLDGLIERALTTNNDLAAATIKVRKARLSADREATNRTPDLSVSANSSTRRDLEHGDRTESSGTTASLSWELDLLQAEQNVESQKADLADLEQQMVEARNALAVLFDQAPEHWLADPKRLSEMPMPVLDAGIPAAVLGSRPDLMAAEMRLRSTLADANSTRASYYPSPSLTGALGTSSAELFTFLKNPVASLGAGLALPFVQWNEARLNTRIAEADYEQAVIEFRQTLYEALKEVEDALSARNYYRVQENALRRSLALAEEAERVSEVRYTSGKTGVQDWLDQQETRRSADLALAKNRYNQLKNMMTLYQALGGDATVAEESHQR